MSYLTLKTLHVLGAVLFMGNIIVTAVWKMMADRTRDPAVVAFGQRVVTLTDFLFTGAGAAIILITGMGMAHQLGQDWLRIKWIVWGLGLFVVSGIIWSAILIPIQIKQSRLARGFAAGGEIPERYWRLNRIWLVVGLLATVLPLANLYFMVFKPA